jgi:uncharacterized alpha-E superfamily protein
VISRVAECCYWLNRYIERAESTARIVGVNRFSVLDANLHDAERWKPVVVVVGERERFEELLGEGMYDNDNASEEYLTWSEHNPVSIRGSLYWARENARITREVISREMWETVNTSWQWLNGPAAAKEYKKDRAQSYLRIRSMCAEFQGVCQNTMLHEEPFDFMRLGMLLERGSQTARLMDVKHHWLTRGARRGEETPRESAQWAGLLRMCAATEPFFKRTRSAPTGPRVAEFLMRDAAFPRSLLHCFDRADNFLQLIGRHTSRRSSSATHKSVKRLAQRLRRMKVSAVVAEGLHTELTEIIAECTRIGAELHDEFFDPGSAAT